MKKKIIIGSLLAVFVLVIGVLIFSPRAEIKKSCTTDMDDNLVCFTLSLKEPKAPFVIVLEPTVPNVGEKFTVTLGLELPCFQGRINTAMLYLQDSTKTIDGWNFLSLIEGGYGCMMTYLTTSFTAPSPAGDYILLASISTSSSADRAFKEVKNFKVGTIDCPDNSCTSWKTIFSVDNGIVKSRQCSTYGSPPDCKEDVDFQYRTECSSGYNCVGYESSVCDGQRSCEKERECDDGRECTDSTHYRVCAYGQWGATLECPSSIPNCVDGVCKKTDECSTSSDCNDNNVCTEDNCDIGSCIYVSSTLDGERCGINKVCSDGMCIPKTDPCAGIVCNDFEDCTRDWCEVESDLGICKTEVIPGCGDDCAKDEDCLQPTCIGAKAVCESGKCRIEGECPVCKAYQKMSDEGVCKFSFERLASSSGFKEFYSDYKTGFWIGVIALIFVIGLIIYLVRSRQQTMF